jgi:cytochrome c oxidase subunit 2
MKLQDTSVFDANSPQARAIAHLFYFDLVITAVIFLTVAALVFYIVIRFRQRPGEKEPFQDPGNPKLETLWTVIPALILLALLVATAYTMRVVNPPVVNPTPNVIINAHQWWWEYRYPGSGVVTANELHMPVGRKWLLQVESADVIHDFWVPDLGAKVDAIPRNQNYLWITPSKTGIYLGTCAEYCGRQHALMGIRVIVQSPEEFEAWQQSQLRIPSPPTGVEAERGARLFEEQTCINCHAIAGTKAKGTVGPDLTHVGDRQTLGSGAVSNTLDQLTQWIKDPQAIKPGCNMPNLKLTEAQARDIAVYLESLK